jgi:hypothetical protein
MAVAITFRAQSQQKRRQDEERYSFFGRSEAESLPHLIEFETPTLFQLAKLSESIFSLFPMPRPNHNGAAMSPHAVS